LVFVDKTNPQRCNLLGCAKNTSHGSYRFNAGKTQYLGGSYEVSLRDDAGYVVLL
jgi:hypothetical protein